MPGAQRWELPRSAGEAVLPWALRYPRSSAACWGCPSSCSIGLHRKGNTERVVAVTQLRSLQSQRPVRVDGSCSCGLRAACGPAGLPGNTGVTAHGGNERRDPSPYPSNSRFPIPVPPAIPPSPAIPVPGSLSPFLAVPGSLSPFPGRCSRQFPVRCPHSGFVIPVPGSLFPSVPGSLSPFPVRCPHSGFVIPAPGSLSPLPVVPGRAGSAGGSARCCARGLRARRRWERGRGAGPGRGAERGRGAAPGAGRHRRTTDMALAPPLLEPPWPPSLAPLKAVDDLLRCGICFDYFSIAVIIPQCSHSYCSLCIRKFLSYKTQCPTCCVAVSESDLKNNRILDDLVKSFSSARQQLLQLVLDAPPSPSPPAHSHRSPGSQPDAKEVPGIDSFLRKDKICTSTKAGGLAWSAQKSFKTEEHHDLDGASAEVGGKDNKAGSQEIPGCTESPEKPSTSVVKGDKKVECPVCEVAVLEQYINKHLDSCLTREEKKDSLRSSAHKRKLMSKVVYNLLSDRDLRKKLKEHGLSTSGTRQQLIRRHQEFVHMYNAQCDSLNPKSVAEVVKELEKNEKIRAQLECNKPAENSLTFTKDQTEEEIDEIHAEYRNKHRSEFKFLMDQVNKRWKKIGERKAESDQKKEEVSVKELPAATEPGEEHHTAGKAQALQSEIPDGQRSEPYCLKEWQRSASPEFSLSSGSTSSTNSDILADVEGSETCSASSESSSSVALAGSRRTLRRLRVPDSDRVMMPQGKRKRS